jgi:serine/threonine-protein kinase
MGSVEAALEIGPSRSEPDLEEAEGNHPPERGEGAYQRIVALKRLLPDSARDKRRVDMFLREARLAAMLDHPNVVSAYDYGEIDGELYLAMEYVEGQPLSRVLKALSETSEHMPTSVVAWLLAEVCRGLHAAHELANPSTGLPLQLVHRDVSPQNVMLGYDGRVRLLDFGVAKIETENVTKTGEVKGKTAYMSPEQAMGEPLDRRSDLFGVGALLFECLALRRMWGEGTDMEVIRKLALESPPALEACGIELPKGLSEIHARLVAREAKNRPATAIEVAGDLDAFVDDPEAATQQLRAILEAHFADQANEQRARLTTALQEVAPRQADELRESILPASAMTPIRKGAPTVADADADAGSTRAGDERPVTTGTGKTALGLGGLAVVALIAWRLFSGSATNTALPNGAVSATAPTFTTAPSTSLGSTDVTATPGKPSTTSALPTAVRSVSAPSSTTAAVGRSASNTTTSATTIRTNAAPPRATPSARPTNTVKPPDLDEKPF